jgi:hypothetical protein
MHGKFVSWHLKGPPCNESWRTGSETSGEFASRPAAADQVFTLRNGGVHDQ